MCKKHDKTLCISGRLWEYSPLGFADVRLERKFLVEFHRNAVSGGALHLAMMVFASFNCILRWAKDPMRLETLRTLSTGIGCLLFAALLIGLWLWNRGLLVRHWQVCSCIMPFTPRFVCMGFPHVQGQESLDKYYSQVGRVTHLGPRLETYHYYYFYYISIVMKLSSVEAPF